MARNLVISSTEVVTLAQDLKQLDCIRSVYSNLFLNFFGSDFLP